MPLRVFVLDGFENDSWRVFILFTRSEYNQGCQFLALTIGKFLSTNFISLLRGCKRQNIVYFEMDTASLFLPKQSFPYLLFFLPLILIPFINMIIIFFQYFLGSCINVCIYFCLQRQKPLRRVRTISFCLHHPHKHTYSFSLPSTHNFYL